MATYTFSEFKTNFNNFSNSDINSIVKIPLDNGTTMDFQIIGINAHKEYDIENNKYTNKKTISLCTAKILDLVPFDKQNNTRWKDCSLRKYLNNTFYHELASDVIDSMVNVRNTTVIPNQYKSSSSINKISDSFDVTDDKIFIPSLTELNNKQYNFSLNDVTDSDEIFNFPQGLNLKYSEITIKEGSKFNSFNLQKEIDPDKSEYGKVMSSRIDNAIFNCSLSSLISSDFDFQTPSSNILSTIIDSNLGISFGNYKSIKDDLFQGLQFPLTSKILANNSSDEYSISFPINSNIHSQNDVTINFGNGIRKTYDFDLIKKLSGSLSSEITSSCYDFIKDFNNKNLYGYFNTGRKLQNNIISVSNSKLYTNSKYYTLCSLSGELTTTYGKKQLKIDLIPNSKIYQNVLKNLYFKNSILTRYYLLNSSSLNVFDKNNDLYLPFNGSIKFNLNEIRNSINLKTNIVINNNKQIHINLKDYNKAIPSTMFNSLSNASDDIKNSALISGKLKNLELNGECHLTSDNILEINLNGDMNNINDPNLINLHDYLLNNLTININCSLNEENLQYLKLSKKISESDITQFKITYGSYWTRSIDEYVDSRVSYIDPSRRIF